MLSLIHLLAVLATEIYQVLDDICFSDLGSSYFAADAIEEDKAAEIDCFTNIETRGEKQGQDASKIATRSNPCNRC